VLLSISNSKRSSPAVTGHSILVWVAVMAAVLVGMEVATRVGFDRISKLQRRMRDERRLANSTLRKPGSAPTLLMAGNSLLLEGVDFETLRAALEPRTRAYRYIVTQTVYFDWYYGLRRLFDEGIRPTYLVFGLSSSQLVRSSTRGDYAAYYLFDLPGLLEYSRRERLDLTTASSLVFAHYSAFYAVRSEIRATLVEKLFPSYFNALHDLTVGPGVRDDPERVPSVAAERLNALENLCSQNGVKLLYVLPPTDVDSEAPIIAAGRRTGVPVLLPVSRGSLKSSHFADGFHLNKEGRAIFTKALEQTLATYIGDGKQVAQGGFSGGRIAMER
jgi:hypothetical protein